MVVLVSLAYVAESWCEHSSGLFGNVARDLGSLPALKRALIPPTLALV